jgi:uncharacterized protein YuzB (UPF0349 family)
MAEVHFCKKNLSQGVDKLIGQMEEELADVEVKLERCLEFCEDCASRPIAITNGYFIKDDSIERLYE